MTKLAAVILTGGKSSRMGKDKASLPYKGKRLVDITADTIRQAGIADIYISGKIEGYNSLPDMQEQCGPVGGICSCATKLCRDYNHALFIPVDMPHLNSELLALLIETEQNSSLSFENHPLPCIIPLDEKTIAVINDADRKLTENGKISVKSLLASLGVKTIPVPAHLETALTNTNTPEEWQEATSESTH